MKKRIQIIVTCEHSGNKVPAAYRGLFDGKIKWLSTHKGYDIGALRLARRISKALSSSLNAFDITRLLVDANRSFKSRNLFSGISRRLTRQQKQEVLEKHYLPYRNSVSNKIKAAVESGQNVIHISMHTFTPFARGKKRDADIGILYDPSRNQERSFSCNLKKALSEYSPEVKVRFNFPYRGTSDGFTTALRKIFPENKYAGIELEVNQKYFLKSKGNPESLCKLIITSLKKVLFCSRQQDF